MARRLITAPVPVSRYPSPSYPSRAAVRTRPGFLLRHLPRRWQGDRLLLLLLGGTLPGAPGCADPAEGVAPVSEHGEGVGWFGCEVIVPPVFLSEDEALAIVKDELQAAGLSGLDEGVALEDVQVGRIEVEDCGDGIEASASDRAAFEADLYDPAALLAIEVVTDQDFEAQTGDGDPGCESSVDSHDLKGMTEVLAAELEERGAGRWYALAYDPVVYPDTEAYGDCWSAEDVEACQAPLEEAARVETEAALRAQVQDLVAWMREKGLL